ADAEEGAMPERWQAGVAEHQVEGQRIGCEDQDLDAQILVEADALDPQRHAGKEQPTRQHGGGEGRDGAASLCHASIPVSTGAFVVILGLVPRIQSPPRTPEQAVAWMV